MPHPFMQDDDDGEDGSEAYRPLSTATELLLSYSPRQTPLTICFHASHEKSPERDATMLATALSTSLDFDTFKILSLLMFQMLQVRMQQQAALNNQFNQMFERAAEADDSGPEEGEGPNFLPIAPPEEP